MIIFDLRCAQGHGFEGWFASGEEFERQKAADLVHCPMCDSAEVVRRPSAQVRVRKAAAPKAAKHATQPEKAAAPEAVASLPPDVLAHLREVVRKTEDVGARFPEEARRIHYDEAPARAIRGQASKEEAEALTEEGIDFTSLPPFLTRDQH
jgi:hypothetical protein